MKDDDQGAADQSVTAEPMVLRREVEQLRSELANTRQGILEFVSMLAHELRTPLGAVLMWAHVLRMGRESDRATAIEAIETSAQDQSRLIGKVLDLTRALAGRLPLAHVVLDLSDLLAVTLDDARPMAIASQVELILVTAIEQPPIVKGDAGRLRAVLSSLFASAVQRTSRQGQVEVVLSSTDDCVRIVLRDGGPALSPQQAMDLFTPFRLPGDPYSGALALDLALARLVVDLHQGSIRAEGQPSGQGNVLSLSLPREPSAQVATSP